MTKLIVAALLSASFGAASMAADMPLTAAPMAADAPAAGTTTPKQTSKQHKQRKKPHAPATTQ